VSYENGVHVASYRLESDEGDWHSHEMGSGYTMPLHGGYHAVPPRDQLFDLRSAICRHLDAMGVPLKYHHHEVGGPGQCEIETPLLSMVKAGDAAMLLKYVARMTALARGLSVTFMPKPLYGEAGSGMHFHQRLEAEGANLFYDADGYGCLSQVARYYIGGILAHGGAVLAFTNPSTNSYRRLVPGYEAPVSAIYSAGNRSAAVRIPKYANSAESARVEFRPPDGTSNPYLATAVQLMAGLDGVRSKIDPTERGFGPVDDDIFSWPEDQRQAIPSLPTSLDEALDALDHDREFLLAGKVFSDDLIDRWIEAKRRETTAVRHRPHPYEIELYYDL
jgi:glutamine synthetase